MTLEAINNTDNMKSISINNQLSGYVPGTMRWTGGSGILLSNYNYYPAIDPLLKNLYVGSDNGELHAYNYNDDAEFNDEKVAFGRWVHDMYPGDATFKSGVSGDIFVQKSPAATIETLAIALKELFNATNEIQIIGARHGEKMYESLCGKEEMSKAEDLDKFFRVPADLRDLNYTKYLQEDGPRLQDQEYNIFSFCLKLSVFWN